MADIHNVMVKKHNSTDKILIFLLNNKTEEFTIRAIAQKTKIDYKTTYLVVNEFIEKELILAKKVGQTVLCKLNRKAFDEEIFKAETIRKEKLLKNKDLLGLKNYIAEIKESFFIMLVFGSWASGKNSKNSDIDLLLITDDDQITKKVKKKLKLLPLDIHLVNFSTEEFIKMQKSTEFNVGKEASDNNVILFGIEDYYRLIRNA